MTTLKPETRNDPEQSPRPNQSELRATVKVIVSGMAMIGKKGTWESNGSGAQLSPRQIIAGAVVGGLVLVALLLAIARLAIYLATG